MIVFSRELESFRDPSLRGRMVYSSGRVKYFGISTPVASRQEMCQSQPLGAFSRASSKASGSWSVKRYDPSMVAGGCPVRLPTRQSMAPHVSFWVWLYSRTITFDLDSKWSKRVFFTSRSMRDRSQWSSLSGSLEELGIPHQLRLPRFLRLLHPKSQRHQEKFLGLLLFSAFSDCRS